MKLKGLIFLSYLVFYALFLNGQNLILNPGFENYITCPGFGQFGNTWINDWHKPGYGSSDYYHYNCPGIIPAPGSAPKTGNAEAGIILFNYGTEYREYITATLSQPLTGGVNYYVEFYLALNTGYIQAVKEAGAYFSDSVPGPYTNSLSIPVIPQITNTGGFIAYGWHKVSGNYLAVGGEKYLTIGNFENDSNTTTNMVGTTGSFGSYYFVDDVFVGASDSVPQIIIEQAQPDIRTGPNPVNISEHFLISLTDEKPFEFILFDCYGREIKHFEGFGMNNMIRFDEFSAGMYFFKVNVQNRIYENGKLILVK